MQRVIGYVRVSTEEQRESGAGLEAQRKAIRLECARRGWELVAIHEDRAASGKSLNGRPGLRGALDAIEGGKATALVVAKLDRLSRSLMDFANLMERSRQKRWALAALDLGVDTTTPSGEMVANVLAVFAQFERRLIGQRTREALAIKRARGVRLGRPPAVPQSVLKRVVKLRAAGMSLPSIARVLNDGHVKTAHGGRQWYPGTVAKLVVRDAGLAATRASTGG